MKKQHIHLIGIGGSIMHNLALTLSKAGHVVTGSDNDIYDPAKSRLDAQGLLPSMMGWDESAIHTNLDIVILGMTAHLDNPELIKAKELGLTIMTYPEYITHHSITKNQKRVVVAGSHGKTTTTAMIVHILKTNGIDCDYLIGSQLPGYETMVRLTDAPLMIIEGDEYPESRETMRPKCHVYQHHIGVVNGIDRDHVNIFPTFESYVDAFRTFVKMTPEDGKLLRVSHDEEVKKLMEEPHPQPLSSREGRSMDDMYIPYTVHPYIIIDGIWHLIHKDGSHVPLQIFGKHNMSNLAAAIGVCRELGLDELGEEQIYSAVQSFPGTARRLTKVSEDAEREIVVYQDFAHAPSKVRATVDAVREQFPEHRLVACFELHTYSSTDASFLSHYAGTLDAADSACVYASAHAFEIKRRELVSGEQVRGGFERSGEEALAFCTTPEELGTYMDEVVSEKTVVLMMSSGTFDGYEL